jgi:hypothetical protein
MHESRRYQNPRAPFFRAWCDSERRLTQAWSSGAAFMLLQAILGYASKEVHIQRPMLPIGIESLSIHNLGVGEALINMEFHRLAGEVVVAPLRHAEHGVRVLAHL